MGGCDDQAINVKRNSAKQTEKRRRKSSGGSIIKSSNLLVKL